MLAVPIDSRPLIFHALRSEARSTSVTKTRSRELPLVPDSVQRVADLLDSFADGNEAAAGVSGSAAEAEATGQALVWLQDPNVDKYAWPGGVAIDCESRLHLCRAACCRLRFPLSEQDVLEGVVAWDDADPYMIAQADDGCCVHQDRTTLRCRIYEKRPLPCRAFDCRADRRIWLDFENRIPSPALQSKTEPTEKP